MPSGRKNRGSRHRAHKQHQKQELEESADYDPEVNLRHGPLPDSDSSAWTMGPLPSRVEGPTVLKQGGENADSLVRGINRKNHQELQRESANAAGFQLSSKRKKGTVTVRDEANASTTMPSSLDRWDGGDSRTDETIALFDSVSGESQFYDLTSSKQEVVVEKKLGWKEVKGEGDGKSRKLKVRAGLGPRNRAMAVMDASGTSLGDISTRTKNKVSRRRDFSEIVGDETDKSLPGIDCTPTEILKGQMLGSNAFDEAKSQRGASAKRWDKDASRKEIDVEACPSNVLGIDSTVVEPERKRGKTSDLGAHFSPRFQSTEDVPKIRRSEGSQKPRKSGNSAKVASRDDGDALEEHRTVSSDAAKDKIGTEWILQDDHRNLELEKELKNRIRYRRGESGDRDKWRDDDKDRETRVNQYQEDERCKDGGWCKDENYNVEKYQEEKLKDDGGDTERYRSDSQHRDENHRELWHVKEEKHKADKEGEERHKDEKECEGKSRADKNKEERSIHERHKDDRHKDDRKKDEKEREDRQMEDKDARQKENKLKESRCRVDKEKEGRHKDEQLKFGDHSACHREEKDRDDSFQDQKDKQGRQQDKDDKFKDKEKFERFDKFKKEKPKDDNERLDQHREDPDRDAIRDGKGKYDKKKSDKEQDDGVRSIKLQCDRLKVEMQQDGREKSIRKIVDKQGDERVADGKQREDRVKEEKLQDYQHSNERYMDHFRKFDKYDMSASERLKDEIAKDDKDKHELQGDIKDDRRCNDSFRGENDTGIKETADEWKAFSKNNDKKQADCHSDEMLRDRAVRKRGEQIKDEQQMEEQMESVRRFDDRKEQRKQRDAWNKEAQYSMDGDSSASHGEPFNSAKDLSKLKRYRGNYEQGIRGRKSVVRTSCHEGNQRGLTAPWEDLQDQDRSFSSFSIDATKSEHRPKRSRDLTMMDSVIAERDFTRHQDRQCEGEHEFSHEDKVLHSREERGSSYDALQKSPSPSFPDVSRSQSYEKSTHKSKFEVTASLSSSSATWWQRERNRHTSERSNQLKQHNCLEEEVKSWEPRDFNRNSEDVRRRSLSPERPRDSIFSLQPTVFLPRGQEEVSRGSIRGSVLYEDSVTQDREHRRFSHGGGHLKARRVDEFPRERTEWSHQSLQMNRSPMGESIIRPQLASLPNRLSGPSGLLPPPPPFRPGIDNPAILGAPSNAFEEGSGARESGRYNRKSGSSYKRSEMPGAGDTWRPNGLGNWNAQNQGPCPDSMFSPFPQIGVHPSGVFLGMGQQFQGPPMFGPGSARPAADMDFRGARFHLGDGMIYAPGHGPKHAPMMGWHKAPELDETCCTPLPSLLEAWEGRGPYIDERQRLGRTEWDQGAPGMTGRGWDRVTDQWQGKAGDSGNGFNPHKFKREPAYQGSLVEEGSIVHYLSDKNAQKAQLLEEQLLERPDMKHLHEVSPAPLADEGMGALSFPKLRPSNRARARMQMLLLSINVAAKLADSDLYKQYLALLPPSEAKVRELSTPNHRDASSECTEEDFEFELDSEAQELLYIPDSYTDLLPLLPDTAYKDALEVYQRPVQENRVQKSIFGSFLLPVDSALIKMPSLEVELVDLNADRDTLGNQGCSPNEFVVDIDPFAVNNDNGMGPLSSAKDPSYERVETEEKEIVHDYEGLQIVEVDLLNEQVGGMVEDFINKGGGSQPIMVEVEGMVTTVNEDKEDTSPLFVKLSVHSEFPVVEGNSVLCDLSEERQKSVTNCREEMPPTHLCKSPNTEGQIVSEVESAVLLAISFETNGGTCLCGTDADRQAMQSGASIDLPVDSQNQSIDNHPAKQVEASQQAREDLDVRIAEDGVGSATPPFCSEDGVGSATPPFCSDGRVEESKRDLEEAVEVEDDDLKECVSNACMVYAITNCTNLPTHSSKYRHFSSARGLKCS